MGRTDGKMSIKHENGTTDGTDWQERRQAHITVEKCIKKVEKANYYYKFCMHS